MFKKATATKNIFLFISAVLLFYVVARAVMLSFTHDESLSYALVKWESFLRETANNHLLNTFFLELLIRNGYSSEFFLRLPNVLFFVLFLFALYKILNLKMNTTLFFVGFGCVVLNPYLLDFFSLARGYGISLGAMLMSLYFYLNYIFKNNGIKNYYFSMLFAVLAVWANLTLINFYLIVFGLFFLHRLFNSNFKTFFKLDYLLPTLIFCFPVYLFVLRLLALSSAGELYFGSDDFQIFQNSLSAPYFYNYKLSLNQLFVLKSVVQLSYLLGVIFAIFLVYKKQFSNLFLHVFIIFTSLMVVLYLENIFFEAKFPAGRTGVYWFPLYGLFIYFLLSESVGVIQTSLLKKGVTVVSLLTIAPVVLFVFLYNINIKHCYDWHYDADTKGIMETVALEIKKDNIPTKTYIVYASWLLEPTINYYTRSKELPIKTLIRNEVREKPDFIVESDTVASEIEAYIKIKSYPFLGLSLYKASNDTLQVKQF